MWGLCVSGMGSLRTWGPRDVPFISLSMSPVPRDCWVNQGLLSWPFDAASSLAGFVHQEEEEVTPQVPSKTPVHGQCWAGLQGTRVGKESPPIMRAPLLSGSQCLFCPLGVGSDLFPSGRAEPPLTCCLDYPFPTQAPQELWTPQGRGLGIPTAPTNDNSVAHGPTWFQEWVTIPPRPPI